MIRYAVSADHELISQCPLCSSNERRHLFDACDVQYSCTYERFPMVSCSSCGVWYLAKRPTLKDISRYYVDGYPAYRQSDSAPGEKGYRILLKRRMKDTIGRREKGPIIKVALRLVPAYWRLASEFPVGSSVLDVGCGVGARLDLFRETGWRTLGVEISEKAAEIARTKGHDILLGRFDEVMLPDNSFEAIQMAHVLEHLPDPVKSLRKAHRLLRKGGVLLIETPNKDSLLGRIFGSHYWQIDSPRHFQLFGRACLEQFLDANGFAVEVRATFGAKGAIWNSVKAIHSERHHVLNSLEGRKMLKVFLDTLEYCSAGAKLIGMGDNILMVARKKTTATEEAC